MTADIREHTWGTKQQSWSCRWLAVTTTPAPPLTRQEGGRLRRTVPPLHPTVDLHPHVPPGSTEPFDARALPLDLGVRWTFTVWPAWKEPLFAAGATGGRLRWDEDNGPVYAPFLEPLVDPTTPFGPMACLLLARGLGAKQAGDHGLAVDAAIAALADGRLDGEGLGAALAITLPGAKAPRLARTLSEVARASPMHGLAVARALVRGLRGEPPRDIGALLEVLQELLVEHGLPLDDVEATAYLTGVAATGGKAGKTARALLAAASVSASPPRGGGRPSPRRPGSRPRGSAPS